MIKDLRYRLGLDMGANSLGWCLVELNEENPPKPIRLIRMGVRLFRDGRRPKDKQSLAVDRRLARQMRRRRDRWLKRQHRLLDALIRHDLLPAEEAARKALVQLDPYTLRHKALDEALLPHHIGRALFHLNQRRGFKSNRKVDKADEKESGKIKSAIARVKESLAEKKARTIGEWLAMRHFNKEKDASGVERLKPLPVRARLRGEGVKAAYELYFSRDLIEQEFDAIWAAQAAHQPKIFTTEIGDELKDILLHQRPLVPVKPGKCTLEPDDKKGRAPIALPSSQRFRILQELNNLRYSIGLGQEVGLSRSQRDQFAAMLEGRKGAGKKEKADSKGKLTFEKMRQLLKLPKDTPFNLQSDKRDGLKGNATSLVLAKKDRFGDRWHDLTLAEQEVIVEKLLDVESEADIISWLKENAGLDEDAARKVANTGLADGHVNLGRRALSKVLPALEADVITYDKAVIAAGYASHSQLHTGEIFKELPYYGIPLERHVAFGSGEPKDSDEKRYGRIANPTVHIGLNQLRRVVNAVIERYGPPTQVALEVTRELKQSRDQKDRILKEQAKNQEQRDLDRVDLTKMGQRETGEALLRMKLWRELNVTDPMNRCCPYTGRQIGSGKLFSDEVEIEHILPFSRTLDDSIANKTLCFREANRHKKNGTPVEAFGKSQNGYDWEKIQAHAFNMPKNKQWRFAENAMELFEAKHGSDFLARHLNDTAYLSRIAKAYLGYICNPSDIWVTPGRLTALLRGKWGLNKLLSDSGKKDRTDHRHHAVDAATIAVTDRGLLKQIATLSGQERLERERDRIMIPYAWIGFREAIEAALPRIAVSYKPDHGHQAGLHNDTAYGFAEPYDPDNPSEVVHRVPLISFTKDEDLESIRDEDLRGRVRAHINKAEGKEFTAKLAEFVQKTGIHRVRIVETLTVIPMGRGLNEATRKSEKRDMPYKAYKGDSNYCVEIYRDEKGKWRDNVITSFHANQVAKANNGIQRLRHKSLAQNERPLVMRLCKEDTIAIGENDTRQILRLVKFSDGVIVLAATNEGGNLKARDADKSDPFKYISKSANQLFELKARRVFITELGFVHDPGFKS